MLAEALYYNSIGLSVIPIHGIKDGKCTCRKPSCSKPGKHPRIKWRLRSKEALTEDELKALWKRLPNSNVGIVTGEISGIAVVDIDGREGVEAMDSIGLRIAEMPVTPSAMTGGGGYHLIYRLPKDLEVKTRSRVLDHVDIRANGGIIVAPPSLHASGIKYEWMKDRGIGEIPIARFDFSLLEKNREGKPSKKGKKKSNWYEEFLSGVGVGERNSICTRLAGRYFALGLSKKEVKFFLSSWNIHNENPMLKEEISTVLESIYEREAIKDNCSDIIGSISSILRLDIVSVKRITGDEPKFILKFAEGGCTITAAQLLSPKLFQQAVAEATKKIIRKLSYKTAPTHETLVQMIMDCATDVAAGEEATDHGEMASLINAFMKDMNLIPDLDKDDEMPLAGAFAMGGMVWMSLNDLVARGGMQLGIKLTVKVAAQRMTAMGAKRKKFGDRVMWGVPRNG
jgi:hypothetical protein